VLSGAANHVKEKSPKLNRRMCNLRKQHQDADCTFSNRNRTLFLALVGGIRLYDPCLVTIISGSSSMTSVFFCDAALKLRLGGTDNLPLNLFLRRQPLLEQS
jgi:hypothetical protein